jgi:hypothetical protein
MRSLGAFVVAEEMAQLLPREIHQGAGLEACDLERGHSMCATPAGPEAVGTKQEYASPPSTQKLNLILHGFG